MVLDTISLVHSLLKYVYYLRKEDVLKDMLLKSPIGSKEEDRLHDTENTNVSGRPAVIKVSISIELMVYLYCTGSFNKTQLECIWNTNDSCHYNCYIFYNHHCYIKIII